MTRRRWRDSCGLPDINFAVIYFRLHGCAYLPHHSRIIRMYTLCAICYICKWTISRWRSLWIQLNRFYRLPVHITLLLSTFDDDSIIIRCVGNIDGIRYSTVAKMWYYLRAFNEKVHLWWGHIPIRNRIGSIEIPMLTHICPGDKLQFTDFFSFDFCSNFISKQLFSPSFFSVACDDEKVENIPCIFN